MSVRGARATGALLTALLLVALTLRGPLVAPAPVIDQVAATLGLTSSAAGLLTGLGVLCFATLTPLAALALGRAGTTRMLALALLAILGGTLLRSFGGVPGAFVGTVVVGAAITVGNVGVPVVVARDFPTRVPRVMGLYSSVMNAGAWLTTLGTAPLAALVGWRWALTAWGLLALLALVVWLRVAGDAPRRPTPNDDAARGTAGAALADVPRVPLVRRPVTWLLCLTFVGQASSYMGVTAWLPSVLHDTAGLGHAGAGAGASLFQLCGVLGSVLAPAALARRVPPRVVVLTIAACWLTLPLGLLLAPGTWPAWAVLGGAAQGANFVVLFSVVTAVSDSPAQVRRLSAAVQTVGYAVAAATPSVLGGLHESTSGWTAPLLALVGLLTLAAATHAVAAGHLTRP